MGQRFIAEQGELQGQSISLEEGNSWIVGRDAARCQVVIHDPSVAEAQLLVKRTEEGIVLESLSADHPTLVNEQIITSSPILLKAGDTVRLGGELFRFEETTLDKNEEEFISSALSDVLSEGDQETTDPAAERQPVPESPEPKQETESLEGDEELLFDEEMLKEDEPQDEAEEEPHGGEELEEGELKPNEEVLQGEEKGGMEEEEKPSEKEELHAEDEYLQHEETIFSDEIGNAALAEIDFGVVETGRWLLKVIGGPNTGAEFYMQAGSSYVLGTDPVNCDIVFQDTSVSRQHAKIIVTPEDHLIVEDMKSRNGVLINGELVKESQALIPSTIVTIGTTSFVVYDREGEMQTIISPLLPSIVKVLQYEEQPEGEEAAVPPVMGEKGDERTTQPSQPISPEPVLPQKPQKNYGQLIIFSIIAGLLVLAGIGTTALFQVQQVVEKPSQDAEELIKQVLSPYPALRYSFSKSTGSLLLIGHVVSVSDKNHILSKLQGIKAIKSIDDKGMIIDELAWNEVNTVLNENPVWKGISLHSPEAGQFVLTGYLKTRAQAQELANYISRNFPYLDKLKKQVVIEEDVIQSINSILNEDQLIGINVKVNNGEVLLAGEVPTDKADKIPDVIAKVKQVPGVRVVYNQVRSQNPEKVGIINLSDQYTVSGKSQIGDKYTVLIRGKLLSEGDVLDGMNITKITSSTVFLQQGDKKYRIDY